MIKPIIAFFISLLLLPTLLSSQELSKHEALASNLLKSVIASNEKHFYGFFFNENDVNFLEKTIEFSEIEKRQLLEASSSLKKETTFYYENLRLSVQKFKINKTFKIQNISVNKTLDKKILKGFKKLEVLISCNQKNYIFKILNGLEVNQQLKILKLTNWPCGSEAVLNGKVASF